MGLRETSTALQRRCKSLVFMTVFLGVFVVVMVVYKRSVPSQLSKDSVQSDRSFGKSMRGRDGFNDKFVMRNQQRKRSPKIDEIKNKQNTETRKDSLRKKLDESDKVTRDEYNYPKQDRMGKKDKLGSRSESAKFMNEKNQKEKDGIVTRVRDFKNGTKRKQRKEATEGFEKDGTNIIARYRIGQQNYSTSMYRNKTNYGKMEDYGRYRSKDQKDMPSRNQSVKDYDRMVQKNRSRQNYDRGEEEGRSSQYLNKSNFDRGQEEARSSQYRNKSKYDRGQEEARSSQYRNKSKYDRGQEEDRSSQYRNKSKYDRGQEKDRPSQYRKKSNYDRGQEEGRSSQYRKKSNYDRGQQEDMSTTKMNIPKYERGQEEDRSSQNLQNSNYDRGQQMERSSQNLNVPNKTSYSKWMVITTIQEPTETVRQLAKIPGWKMVVIGDKKTPKGWSVPGVVYLDVEAQLKLGYSLTKHLAFGSYARKIIGYLYAIQHGAEFIYETDDDNVPLTGLKTFHLLDRTNMLMINTQNLTYNHYIHFGHPSLWPRGLPLDYFREDNTQHEYKLCNVQVPAVQQGLVDGDPDFDSVVRLTRTNPDTLTHFDEKAPPVVLPMGTFSPTNSQNTVFRYQAFWSMIIPVTTSFRFCDIFRGYWAQRMLWLTGDRIGYYPTNAVQRRNKHSLINDAAQETDFIRIGVMLKAMLAWKCREENIHLCAIDLSKKMVDMGFLKQQDLDLFDAWFNDLKSLGYVLPEMKGEDHSVCGSSKNPVKTYFYPIPQNASLPHIKRSFLPVDSTNENEVAKFINGQCGTSLHAEDLTRNPLKSLTEDKLLIIHMKGNGDSIPVLETWYRRSFKYIVYCGNEAQIHPDIINKWKISFIALRKPSSKVTCIQMAINMGYVVIGGYLFVPETVLLNSKSILSHQRQKHNFWVSKNWLVTEQETISSCQQNQIKCNRMSLMKLEALKGFISESITKSCFEKHTSHPLLQSGKEVFYLDDVVYYVPYQYKAIIQQMGAVQADVAKHDIRISLLAECFEAKPFYLTYSRLLTPAQPVDFIYPYNAKDVLLKDSKIKSHFCKKGV